MSNESSKKAKTNSVDAEHGAPNIFGSLKARRHAPESTAFAQVLSEEIRQVEELRSASAPRTPDSQQDVYTKAHDSNLAGLAFSGGGIRSATFNLGVIQALSYFGIGSQNSKSLMSRFDYLSTVSGGGYIGSWFSAWVHRDAQENSDGLADEDHLNNMRAKFSAHPTSSSPSSEDLDKLHESSVDARPEKTSPNTSGFAPMEHKAIRFLRSYSNYLTPKLGLSGDMLALVSIFIRNLVLMQLALITFLTSILLFLYLLASVSVKIIHSDKVFLGMAVQELALGIGLVSLLIGLACFGYQVAEVRTETVAPSGTPPPDNAAIPVVMLNGVLVVLSVFSSWLIAISAVGISSVAPLSSYLLIGVVCYSLAWFIGRGIYWFRTRKTGGALQNLTLNQRFASFFSTVIAGAVFGALAYSCATALNTDWASAQSNTLAIITFGPPAMLLVMSFIVTIHIGTAGAMFSEMHREWWARLGGYVLFAMMIWMTICLIAYYSAPVIRRLNAGGLTALVTWASASGAGALFARNASPEGGAGIGSTVKTLVLRLAPWLFMLGMAVLVSFAVNTAFLTITSTSHAWPEALPFAEAIIIATDEFRGVLISDSVLALMVSLAAFVFITFGLDINIFSAHAMYKNRLTRAYLGASLVKGRHEHPFTGFSSADDVPLQNLSKQRPIHIVNTTVNMTGGDDLAWQTRRAASFSFTPNFVGYESKCSNGVYLGGYRPTSHYASGIDPQSVSAPQESSQASTHVTAETPHGIDLGTAVAISGAAASPNMGYHTSATVAALLTAFNMRLGYWGGNTSDTPKQKTRALWTAWWRKRPLFAGRPILAELTGSANAKSDWINLSDGGHFDNLGIYELVRRRCRFIVVTDAGCDPEHQFDDLANAVRKCWTDFGVHISFPRLEEVSFQDGDSRFVERHGSLGTIEYAEFDRGDKRRFGLILYLKSSLALREYQKFVDIRQYADANDSFPHESTADQFFDENQFEAYRHLGYRVVEDSKLDIQRFFDDTSGCVNQDEVYKVAKELRINRKGEEAM
ncbi:MAG: patatin-like phospholipase family protein [Gammaproteobacteria bacterium]